MKYTNNLFSEISTVTSIQSNFIQYDIYIRNYNYKNFDIDAII